VQVPMVLREVMVGRYSRGHTGRLDAHRIVAMVQTGSFSRNAVSLSITGSALILKKQDAKVRSKDSCP
jgi:hypothetical protein